MATPPPQHSICPTVGKPACIEVVAGSASRAGAYKPGSVPALCLLSCPLPRLNLMGGRPGPMLCVCALHRFCQRVFCSQLFVCVCVCVKWSMLSALMPSLSPQLKKRALDQLRLVKSKPQRSPEQPPRQLWMDPCSGELLALHLPVTLGDTVIPCGH